MAADAEDLIDRRRLRRKLSFWRVAAIVLLALGLISLPFIFGVSKDGFKGPGDQIARVSIEGMILEDQDLLDLLDDLKDEDRVKAVVLRLDTPGGTTVGGEAIYQAVRKIAEVKPVATEVGTLAASAGYMIASASDHIVARRTSIVGSIGVIFQYVDASSLLSKVGVQVNSIKSSPIKAEPSPFGPPPEAAKEMIRRLVGDTYGWFVDLVADRRGLSEAEARTVSDGSVFSGQDGLDLKLVDALGGEDEVRRWLEEERDVPEGLEFVDREPTKDGYGLSVFAMARDWAFATVGLDPRAASVEDAILQRTGQLDGLVSLWQPSQERAPLQ